MQRPFASLSGKELDRKLEAQLATGGQLGRPTYYVAYEYIDGSYRPVAAADKSGMVNISFDAAIYSTWTDEENLTWLRARVNDLVRLGKVR